MYYLWCYRLVTAQKLSAINYTFIKIIQIVIIPVIYILLIKFGDN